MHSPRRATFQPLRFLSFFFSGLASRSVALALVVLSLAGFAFIADREKERDLSILSTHMA